MLSVRCYSIMLVLVLLSVALLVASLLPVSLRIVSWSIRPTGDVEPQTNSEKSSQGHGINTEATVVNRSMTR